MAPSLLAEPQWFSVAGLAIDIVAIILLAWEHLIVRNVISGDPGGPGGRDQDPPASPWRRLRREKTTVACVLFLALGFALQIYGTWPR